VPQRLVTVDLEDDSEVIHAAFVRRTIEIAVLVEHKVAVREHAVAAAGKHAKRRICQGVA
jgi:hypothetical protein